MLEKPGVTVSKISNGKRPIYVRERNPVHFSGKSKYLRLVRDSGDMVFSPEATSPEIKLVIQEKLNESVPNRFRDLGLTLEELFLLTIVLLKIDVCDEVFRSTANFWCEDIESTLFLEAKLHLSAVNGALKKFLTFYSGNIRRRWVVLPEAKELIVKTLCSAGGDLR